jgi:hypothetical protein
LMAQKETAAGSKAVSAISFLPSSEHDRLTRADMRMVQIRELAGRFPSFNSERFRAGHRTRQPPYGRLSMR